MFHPRSLGMGASRLLPFWSAARFGHNTNLNPFNTKRVVVQNLYSSLSPSPCPKCGAKVLLPPPPPASFSPIGQASSSVFCLFMSVGRWWDGWWQCRRRRRIIITIIHTHRFLRVSLRHCLYPLSL